MACGTQAERGGSVTCKFGAIKNGKIVCQKDYPVQVMKCLKGGLACYKEREKGGKTIIK